MKSKGILCLKQYFPSFYFPSPYFFVWRLYDVWKILKLIQGRSHHVSDYFDMSFSDSGGDAGTGSDCDESKSLCDTKKTSRDEKSFLVNHSPEMWNQILEELKQLYFLQIEENRKSAFVR